MKAEAIQCPACGEASFLKREPVYDGFTKTGESLHCAACRHVFDSEEQVPFTQARPPAILGAAEPLPAVTDIFDASDIGRTCRHCKHYVVNPFVQRCALKNRDVEATDTCDAFQRRPADD